METETMVKAEVEKTDEKNTVLLKVEVPTAKFMEAVEQAYKRIASQINIPGFRKGKVPKSVIDTRIGQEAVVQDALEKQLASYYFEAVKESAIEPVDQPDIDIDQVEADKPLIFSAKVKVKPEVKLGEYKGLEIVKPATEPTEEEVNEQIEKIQGNFASLEPVEDRAAEMGDFVLIDFKGYVNDEAFEGGSSEDYLLELGSGTFIPGFEEQLVGMNKGDEKDVMVTFPEDYGNEELAGKEAKFHVAAKEIKAKNLQELNDDFAKQVGFDTLDELRDDIQSKIRATKERYSEGAVRTLAVDMATENAEVDVHDIMVEHELDDMLEEFAADVARQGIAFEQYLNVTGMTIEDLRAQWRERAVNRVKNRLVMEAIAKTENIEVSDEDVDNEIRQAAEAAGRSFEEVKQRFAAQATLSDLKTRLSVGKSIDWLLENSVIKAQAEGEQAKGAEQEEAATEAEPATEAESVIEEGKTEAVEENTEDKGTEE